MMLTVNVNGIVGLYYGCGLEGLILMFRMGSAVCSRLIAVELMLLGML